MSFLLAWLAPVWMTVPVTGLLPVMCVTLLLLLAAVADAGADSDADVDGSIAAPAVSATQTG